eukprot:2353841-Ditylum_brightwellii.AAC.1
MGHVSGVGGRASHRPGQMSRCAPGWSWRDPLPDDGQVYYLGLWRGCLTGMWHLATVLRPESRHRGSGSHDEPALGRAW